MVEYTPNFSDMDRASVLETEDDPEDSKHLNLPVKRRELPIKSLSCSPMINWTTGCPPRKETLEFAVTLEGTISMFIIEAIFVYDVNNKKI
tara:strand:- start:160 stop:432 length:273 start_codon:yes stop_codon:yes gene_type:complete